MGTASVRGLITETEARAMRDSYVSAQSRWLAASHSGECARDIQGGYPDDREGSGKWEGTPYCVACSTYSESMRAMSKLLMRLLIQDEDAGWKHDHPLGYCQAVCTQCAETFCPAACSDLIHEYNDANRYCGGLGMLVVNAT